MSVSLRKCPKYVLTRKAEMSEMSRRGGVYGFYADVQNWWGSSGKTLLSELVRNVVIVPNDGFSTDCYIFVTNTAIEASVAIDPECTVTFQMTTMSGITTIDLIEAVRTIRAETCRVVTVTDVRSVECPLPEMPEFTWFE